MRYSAPAPQDWADAQPHGLWAEARAEGAAVPAAGSSYDARDAVVVTQFAAADAVVRDAETFSSSIHTQTAGVFKGETMRGMDGDEHRRHRALVASAFRPSAVERWRTTAIEPVIHELIDAIEPLGRADLVADVTTRFPVQVICTIIGLPRDDHQQFVEWSEAINLGVLDPERGHAAADALTGYLRPIVDARRVEPADDLISGLAHAEIDGEGLSEDRIYSFLRCSCRPVPRRRRGRWDRARRAAHPSRRARRGERRPHAAPGRRRGVPAVGDARRHGDADRDTRHRGRRLSDRGRYPGHRPHQQRQPRRTPMAGRRRVAAGSRRRCRISRSVPARTRASA